LGHTRGIDAYEIGKRTKKKKSATRRPEVVPALQWKKSN